LTEVSNTAPKLIDGYVVSNYVVLGRVKTG
jgi:hypothetical protein